MPFSSLVAQSLECQLSGYFKIDKSLFTECLNGIPAYSNCLITGVDPATDKREVSYFIPQGEIFDPNVLPDLFAKNYHYELIFFDVRLESVPIFSSPGIRTFKLSSTDRLSAFASLVIFENTNSYIFRDYMLSASLEKIAIYVLRDMYALNRDMYNMIHQHFDNERLLKLLTYIHRHLWQEIALENLAELADLSPDYISQFFKRCIGMSIQSYLIDQRVRHGLNLLVTSSEQIAVVSENTGFIDQAYFNRRFKMFFSVNPLKLRKKYQLLAVSQAGALMASAK